MNNLNKYNYEPYNTVSDDSMIMTVPELADYLRIGRNRAYSLLKDGIIHGFRIGNSWKVSKQAVDKYILETSKLL